MWPFWPLRSILVSPLRNYEAVNLRCLKMVLLEQTRGKEQIRSSSDGYRIQRFQVYQHKFRNWIQRLFRRSSPLDCEWAKLLPGPPISKGKLSWWFSITNIKYFFLVDWNHYFAYPYGIFWFPLLCPYINFMVPLLIGTENWVNNRLYLQ